MTAGKVRYIALSDVPAWVAAQAQTITGFRGWAPVTALQLEYSLLERGWLAGALEAGTRSRQAGDQPGFSALFPVRRNTRPWNRAGPAFPVTLS